MPAAEEVVIG